MSQHAIVHIEFAAKDPKAAGDFYGKLFGWKIGSMPEMDYVTFEITPEFGGGFLDVKEEAFSPGDIIPYIATPDIEATLTQVEALGGKIIRPKTEIPGVGWYALFRDPTGNRMGLFSGPTE